MTLVGIHIPNQKFRNEWVFKNSNEITKCFALRIYTFERRSHVQRTHDGKIPNSLQPKFKVKSQSQINIWDLDIKA